MNEVPNPSDVVADGRKSNSSTDYGMHIMNEPSSIQNYSQGRIFVISCTDYIINSQFLS